MKYCITKKQISKKLKQLRGSLRQKEIAATLGIKKSRYQAWEEARAEPPKEYREKLAEFYGAAAWEDLFINIKK